MGTDVDPEIEKMKKHFGKEDEKELHRKFFNDTLYAARHVLNGFLSYSRSSRSSGYSKAKDESETKGDVNDPRKNVHAFLFCLLLEFLVCLYTAYNK